MHGASGARVEAVHGAQGVDGLLDVGHRNADERLLERAVLAVAGRLPLGPAPLAAAWAGIVLGSLPLYALGLGVALRLGRNAAIGAGAAGVLLAFFSVGGLAHGLMTGELTGALATPLSWVPLAWPARLGSLGVEAFIDAARAAGPLLTTALAGLVLTLAAAAVLIAWFCHFEDGRADA